MSMKLNLADRLLAMGRRFQTLGRDRDARQILGKLAGFGDLTPDVAEETQARLGEIHLKRRKLKRARRHITTALLHRPDNARYHYLLASALDTREPAEAQRALAHFRKSLELHPDQPRCLSEYGLLAARLGKTVEGLAALRRAVEIDPADPQVVGNLVESLRHVGDVAEARAAILVALFRNPRDRRFHKLRSDFEMSQLCQQQRAARTSDQSGPQREDEPILLPFVRPTDELAAKKSPQIVRRDGPTRPAMPHFPHLRSGQRRAL